MEKLNNARLLVVDDEAPILRLIQQILDEAGYVCDTVQTVMDAKARLSQRSYDLVVTDLKLPDESGLDLLKYLAKSYPGIGRVMMTGYNTMEIAQKVIQIGVYGYLIKPLSRDMVLITVENALRRMLLENHMDACLEETKKDLLEKKTTLQLIMDQINVGIAMVDHNFRIITSNNALKLMFPDIDGMQESHYFDGVPSSSMEELEDDYPMETAFKTKQPFHTKKVIKTEQGVKEVNITAIPIADNSDSVKKGLLLCSDVTDIMENQRDIAESNKLLAVGQLAAGIAHEINTPIQFIGDNIDFLSDSIKDLKGVLSLNTELLSNHSQKQTVSEDIYQRLIKEIESADLEYLIDEIPQAITQTRDGVQRIANLIKAMKKFSHPGEETKTATDINELIKTTLIVCKNEWKYVATIEMNLDKNLSSAQCFESEISQVILILVVNAAHAIDAKMKRGENQSELGKITVETKQHDDTLIKIVISDTGSGIPTDIQEKIFEPFFTTKERGKGTGQGLSLAKKIIEKDHNGDLSLISEPGKGSLFTILLPINHE